MDRFKYTVEFWEDAFDEGEHGRFKVHQGYVMAESFEDAMAILNRYYGQIEQVHLHPECDGEVIIMHEDVGSFDWNWQSPAKNFYC